MAFDPKTGDVIRYDYLWAEEHRKGQVDGSKDRPCAVVLTATPREDGSKRVMLVPITHTPPTADQGGIEIPAKVSKHLGLDDERSWIKTHESNVLTWPKDRLPVGLTRAKAGQWKFGELPTPLEKKVFDDVGRQRRDRTMKQIERDEKPSKPRPKRTGTPRPKTSGKPRPGQNRNKDRGRDM